MSSEDLLAASLLVDTVGKREFETLGEELLDVRAADIGGLLNLNNLENLLWVSTCNFVLSSGFRT